MSKTYKQGYSPFLPYIVALGDFLVINSAFILFFMWYDSSNFQTVVGHYTRVLVCWNTSYFLARMQTAHDAYKRFGHPGRLVRNVVIHFIGFIVLFVGLSVLLTSQTEILANPMMALLLICLFIISMMRISARFALIKYRERGKNTRNLILVGNTQSIEQLFELAYNNPYAGLNVMGYFADEPMDDGPEGLEYLGDTDKVIPWLEQTEIHIHRVYCQVGEKSQPVEHALLSFCESNVIKFYVIPHVSHFVHHSLHYDTFNEVPVLSIRPEPLTDELNKFVKRSFDLLCSCIALCTLFPISFVVIGIGAIFNRRSMFLNQQRMGLNKRPFTCYTYRSFHRKEEGQEIAGDICYENRCRNRWECFLHSSHIDVIPQFWNVFKGDMSIVGPRAHLVENVNVYSEIIDHYLLRHYVRPGITGWSQVHGFYGEVSSLSHIQKRAKWDVWYIENWGFFLDLRILMMTFPFFFKR